MQKTTTTTKRQLEFSNAQDITTISASYKKLEKIKESYI